MAVIKEFEQRYVHDVYSWETIEKRHPSKRWKKVEEFIASFPIGSLIADIGCGEGQYLNSKCHHAVGLERCDQKCVAMGQKNKEVALGSILSLPYRSGFFDGLLCVAVIHHLVTRKRQLKAFRELSRVLATGGRAFVSVIAAESICNEVAGQDVLVPMKSRKPKNSNNSHPDINEVSNAAYLQQSLDSQQFITTTTNEVDSRQQPLILKSSSIERQHSTRKDDLQKKCNPVPVVQSEETVFKYYHIFSDSELSHMISKVKRLKIIDKYFDNRNFVYIFEKV